MLNFNKKKGFTLIELLVVVAVIGLLSSITIVLLRDVKAKSRDAKRIGDIETLVKALHLYQYDNNVYPIYIGYITGTDIMSLALKSAKALPEAPLDPLNMTVNGVIYKYSYSSTNGADYVLSYCLETNSLKGKVAGCGHTVKP